MQVNTARTGRRWRQGMFLPYLLLLPALVLLVGMVYPFLHARIPGRRTLRALMLLPLMMPPVITALDERRDSELSAVIPRRGSHQLVRLHPGGDRVDPDHRDAIMIFHIRYMGQPAIRILDPARCAAGATHGVV